MANQRVHKSDIVIVYHDLEMLKPIIRQVESLDISLQVIPINDSCIAKIRLVRPRIILFSTLNLITSVEFYLDFLKHSQNGMTNHYSVLLTNNRESQRSFVACQNGLFDNYVVINPLNEPNRLSLILIQALKLISEYRGSGIKQLLSEGNENLANCIDKGVNLRETLQKKIEQCKSTVLNDTASIKVSPSITVSIDALSDLMNSELSGLVKDVQHAKNLNGQAIEQLDSANNKNKIQINNQTESLLSNSSEYFENIKTDTSKLTQYKLLVVDSSPLSSKVLSGIFEGDDFDVTIVRNGKEAFEKYKFIKIDLIIIEHTFPDMSGFEIIKQLRDLGSTTPVVAISSNRTPSVTNKWISLGIGAYITKPSTKKIIYDTVLQELVNPTQILQQGDHYNLVKWLPKYSVNNELLDSHHKELFSLVNEFLQNGEDFESLSNTIDKLFSYTEMHFKEEEQVLIDNGYPYAKEHSQQHKAVINKLNILRNKLDLKNHETHEKIGVFLYKWLANHILKSDMHYKGYFLHKGDRAIELS